MLAFTIFNYELMLVIIGINRQPAASPIFTTITQKKRESMLATPDQAKHLIAQIENVTFVFRHGRNIAFEIMDTVRVAHASQNLA
ncbi:hypothetical protein [Silvibacterium dinghuense]|uniref:hypothetical protein n=1 Tax=Silvibacterium dinghuense TaxID=1560006 RepID=UPI0013E94C05|nr:hypothetical protein [Silvibacterium dinghuense]GGH07453.1 hypothetical protein GCM10011586_24720 [Silvibacterium dinghuense]